MSLLLDALKKAAQEKQKASEGIAKDKTGTTSSNKPEKPTDPDVELTLDDDTGERDEQPLDLDPVPELEKGSATTATVSDEALQLLIYKTNKQHRRSQKMLWGSIITTAALVLLISGTSYYYAMLDDVEALERKHKLAMRTVQNQPVSRPHILQSMQENSAERKQGVATEKKIVRSVNNSVAKQSVAAPATKQGSMVAIQKTEKLDPVSVLLNRAWKAYAAQDYATAEKAYSDVLRREPRNRDALLGDAAVAMKKNDYTRAKAAYSLLLRLDPRDPIAIAALAGLNKAATAALDESQLKFMLEQQPEATHIHFALGNIYAKQKKWPQAQNEYFSAWQGNAENADYAFNLAVSLDQIGKYKEARRMYELSLEHATKQNISFSADAVKKRLAQLAER